VGADHGHDPDHRQRDDHDRDGQDDEAKMISSTGEKTRWRCSRRDMTNRMVPGA
jgi:hypothetical protein